MVARNADRTIAGRRVGVRPARAGPRAGAGLAPDRPLAFVDADGRAVRSSDFPGQWLLVYFGYTHCADLCPTGLSVMVNALDQIGPAAAYIQPLFVSVDPERDTGPPAHVRAGVRQAAGGARWHGGAGAHRRGSAGVSFEKVAQGADYTIDHSATYTLIDPARSRALTLRLAEPHQLAAKLIDELTAAGVPLGAVNNVGAYR